MRNYSKEEKFNQERLQYLLENEQNLVKKLVQICLLCWRNPCLH